MSIKVLPHDVIAKDITYVEGKLGHIKNYANLKEKSQKTTGEVGVWFANFFWDCIDFFRCTRRNKKIADKINIWTVQTKKYIETIEKLKEGILSEYDHRQMDDLSKSYVNTLLKPYEDDIKRLQQHLTVGVNDKPIKSNKKPSKKTYKEKLINKHQYCRTWSNQIQKFLQHIDQSLKQLSWDAIQENSVKVYLDKISKDSQKNIDELVERKNEFENLTPENEEKYQEQIKKISHIVLDKTSEVIFQELESFNDSFQNELSSIREVAEEILHTARLKKIDPKSKSNSKDRKNLLEKSKAKLINLLKEAKDKIVEPFKKAFEEAISNLDDEIQYEQIREAIKSIDTIQEDYAKDFPKIEDSKAHHVTVYQQMITEFQKKFPKSDILKLVSGHFQSLLGQLDQLKDEVIDIKKFPEWLKEINKTKLKIDKEIEKCCDLEKIEELHKTLQDDSEIVQVAIKLAEENLKQNPARKHLKKITALRNELQKLTKLQPSYNDYKEWKGYILSQIEEISRKGKDVYTMIEKESEIKDALNLFKDDLNHLIEAIKEQTDILSQTQDLTSIHYDNFSTKISNIEKILTDKGLNPQWISEFSEAKFKFEEFEKLIKHIELSTIQSEEVEYLVQIRKDLSLILKNPTPESQNSLYACILKYIKEDTLCEAIVDNLNEEDAPTTIEEVKHSHLRAYFYQQMLEESASYRQMLEKKILVQVTNAKSMTDQDFKKAIEHDPIDLQNSLVKLRTLKDKDKEFKDMAARLEKEYTLEKFVEGMKSNTQFPSNFELDLLAEFLGLPITKYTFNEIPRDSWDKEVKIEDEAIRLFFSKVDQSYHLLEIES